MDNLKKRQMNLSVLQKIDPHITDILDQASHVVVYDFDQERNKWEKRGIEGTLFICSRNIHPFHGFMILNRMCSVYTNVDMEADYWQDWRTGPSFCCLVSLPTS